MKKITLSILSVFALALVACGPSEAFVNSEKVVNDGIKAIENAQSLQEVQSIGVSLQADLQAIAAEFGDKMSVEEGEKLEALCAKYAAAGEAKVAELVPAPVVEEEVVVEE